MQLSYLRIEQSFDLQILVPSGGNYSIHKPNDCSTCSDELRIKSVFVCVCVSVGGGGGGGVKLSSDLSTQLKSVRAGGAL